MVSASGAERAAQKAHPVRLGLIGLRGVGQVMFQEHAGTGLLFLVGIAVASPLMALGASLGAAIGPVVAWLLRLDPKRIEQGIYGFNSTLVGVALLFYLRPEPLTWVLLTAGCVAATIVAEAMRRLLWFPAYTAPFILVTWLMLVVAHAVGGTSIDVEPVPVEHTPQGFAGAVLDGAAEIMFSANVVTGLVFLVGIAISNWRHCAVGLLGSIAGTLLARYHNDPAASIAIGIYGYNAALAAMAIHLVRPGLLVPGLTALISVPLTEFFPRTLGLPALTAPFVAAAWLVLAAWTAEDWFVRPSTSVTS